MCEWLSYLKFLVEGPGVFPLVQSVQQGASLLEVRLHFQQLCIVHRQELLCEDGYRERKAGVRQAWLGSDTSGDCVSHSERSVGLRVCVCVCQ